MHYIEGKLCEGEVTPATHRYIGMWRPPYSDVASGRAPRPFGCSRGYHEALHQDWIAGLYDVPIYERIP